MEVNLLEKNQDKKTRKWAREIRKKLKGAVLVRNGDVFSKRGFIGKENPQAFEKHVYLELVARLKKKKKKKNWFSWL